MKFFDYQMKFGTFLAAPHRPRISPTIAFEQDLNVIVHMDKLGFDEVWIGEHHSTGQELIASPEVFIATAAERTKRIKLGTGVVALPMHNPLLLADRMVLLSHLTKGRAMFGGGPGQLVKDAEMVGLDPARNRELMVPTMEAIIRLLKGETVTMKSDLFALEEAVLQLRPYSDFDVVVTGGFSPAGPTLAGRLGTGLLSGASTNPELMSKIAGLWNLLEGEAAASGHFVDRSQWRLMAPMHIAETFEEARDQVRFGISVIEEGRAHLNPQEPRDYYDVDAFVDYLNESGSAVIGTPEMARDYISRIVEASGGFGTYLLAHTDWANHQNTLHSLQIFATEVMPHFQGQIESVGAAYDAMIASGMRNADITARAQAAAEERYQQSVGVGS